MSESTEHMLLPICIYFSMYTFNSGYASNYYVMFSQKIQKRKKMKRIHK